MKTKVLEDYMEQQIETIDGVSIEDRITMSPEMHRAEVRKVWPGIRKVIDEAVEAGRGCQILMKRPTKIVPKEESTDGRVHVRQSPVIIYLVAVDTGQEVISE